MAELDAWDRRALIIELVRNLLSTGSWCGETHIQKCVYFLQDLYRVPLGYDFVLYKHGPYSFDLHDELIEMKACEFLVPEPRSPYGPTLRLGEREALLTERSQHLGQMYHHELEAVASRLGNANAADLERLATALFLTVRYQVNRDKRASRLTELKPHISLEDAHAAVAEVDQMLASPVTP